MRDIQYRAWITEEKRFVYSGLITSNDPASKQFVSFWKYLEDMTIYKDDVIVQEYTGLHDKNGVEIYEGDIVMRDGWNDFQEVLWNDGGFVLGSQWSIGKEYTNEMKVIGNIYQHGNLFNK